MGNTVVGIYENLDNARKAIHELVNSGFSSKDIDLSAKGEENATRENPDKDSMGNFFSSLFGNSDDAKYHTEAGYKGYVVTVHNTSRDGAERAADILDSYGAINPSNQAGYSGYSGNTGRENFQESTPSSETSIPVIEEEMQVGKREVETGKVRVRSRIIERPVEEHLRLRTETIDVERNPVNRPANSGDFDHFQEGDIEITEHAEKPVVNKEARVVEEVKVKKEVEEHDETMRGSVKKQDVEVDEKKKERRY